MFEKNNIIGYKGWSKIIGAKYGLAPIILSRWFHYFFRILQGFIIFLIGSVL